MSNKGSSAYSVTLGSNLKCKKKQHGTRASLESEASTEKDEVRQNAVGQNSSFLKKNLFNKVIYKCNRRLVQTEKQWFVLSGCRNIH